MYEDYIAERICALRNQKGVSAREMSLAIGQNSSYINRIENGISLPSMQCFFYICEYFGVTPKDFFDESNVYPSMINELIPILQSLDDAELQVVTSVASSLANK